MITLEYDGTEQSLADWGFALGSARCEHVNLAPSRYFLDQPGGSLSSSPTIPFRGKVVIRRQRTYSAGYSGGYVAFIGYRTNVAHYTSGSEEGLAYTFENAWHFLNNTPYQQPYASYNTVSGSLELKNVSELLLFTRLTAGVLSGIDAGEQISDVLQFVIDIFAAQSMAQPFIIGTIDPDIPFPSYQAREMMSAAVILKCLELSPDVVCVFDYSTTLTSVPTPTIHFLNRTSRTSKSLAIKNGTDHVGLNIVPRHDLVPRAVILTYKISGQYDGHVWTIYATDKYGPNGQNNASDPDGGLDVVLQTIELQGFQQDNVYGKLATEAVNANAAAQADRKTWWSKVRPEFAGTKLRNVVFSTATVKDKDKNTVSLATYPNRLLPESGTILPWMDSGGPITGKWVNIEATVTYDEYDVDGDGVSPETATNGNKIKGQMTKKIMTTAMITNGTTGNYSSLGSFVAGETVPGFVDWDVDGTAVFADGIASKVYVPLSTLQYEGRDVRVQAEISNATNDGPFITLANKLNLTGGHTDWASMNAQIQTISEHDGTGELTVTFGPARHLSGGDLAAMFQFNRLRRVWQNPNLRETADISTTGGGIQMPDKVPAENSTAALSAAEASAVRSTYTV